MSKLGNSISFKYNLDEQGNKKIISANVSSVYLWIDNKVKTVLGINIYPQDKAWRCIFIPIEKLDNIKGNKNGGLYYLDYGQNIKFMNIELVYGQDNK